MRLIKYTYARFATTALVAATATCMMASLSGCKKIEQLEAQMDEYLTAANEIWGFQGSALVAVDGRVILSRGYGMANLEIGTPNTPRTKFFIGSITKQFTAAAILILQQRGLLSIYDPITEHLPDYPHDPGVRITIHNCLTHTSGVPDYTEVPAVMWKRTQPVTPSDLMSLFEHEPLQFEPGTQYRYSNSGYIILGAIIEAVSGQSYEAFLHHEILKPLNMLNTGYARRSAGLPYRADGYTIDDRRVPVDALPVHMSVLHTAGALYSTVEDMLSWDQALYTDRILTEASRKLMQRPLARNYGYGWFIDSLFGRVHMFHGGYLDGFNTTFERWPDDKLCVVVFSNEDVAPVKKIARGLAAIAFDERYDFPITRQAAPIDSALLPGYQGVYEIAAGAYRFVSLEHDTLFIRMPGELPQRLLPLGHDMFFLEADNTVTVQFIRDDTGSVAAHVVFDDGWAYPARRLDHEEAEALMLSREVVLVDPAVYDSYIGRYLLQIQLESHESNFTIDVERDGDHLFVKAEGAEPVEVYPHSETEFFHKLSDFTITFARDTNGVTTGCLVQLSGAAVWGDKIE